MKLLIVIVGATLLSLADGMPTQQHNNAENELTATAPEERNKNQYFVCKIVGGGCVAHIMNEVNIPKIEEAAKAASQTCGLSFLDDPRGPNKDYYIIPSFSTAFLCKFEYKDGAYVSDFGDLRPFTG